MFYFYHFWLPPPLQIAVKSFCSVLLLHCGPNTYPFDIYLNIVPSVNHWSDNIPLFCSIHVVDRPVHLNLPFFLTSPLLDRPGTTACSLDLAITFREMSLRQRGSAVFDWTGGVSDLTERRRVFRWAEM